jgi:hypothetical protein
MTPTNHRLGLALALVLLVGCDSNPEGPRAPDVTTAKAKASGQPTERRPVTKNLREITNPD